MKKFIAFVFLASSSTWAFPLAGNHDPRLFKGNKKNDPAPMACTNFSGNWKGECTVISETGSSTGPSEMVVDMNDCFGVSIDKNFYPINGVKMETIATSMFAADLRFAMDWTSSAKDAISYNMNSNAKPFGAADFIGTGKGIVKMIDGKMTVDSTMTFGGKTSTETCSFAKQ